MGRECQSRDSPLVSLSPRQTLVYFCCVVEKLSNKKFIFKTLSIKSFKGINCVFRTYLNYAFMNFSKEELKVMKLRTTLSGMGQTVNRDLEKK